MESKKENGEFISNSFCLADSNLIFLSLQRGGWFVFPLHNRERHYAIRTAQIVLYRCM